MKSQIKDIVIGIFAVIGFTAIVMGFNNPQEPQQSSQGTWHMTNIYGGTSTSITYMWNIETGEAYRIRGTQKTKVKD